MNLSFVEFLITRLTSWPVVTLFAVLSFRGLFDNIFRFLAVNSLPTAQREAMMKHAREQAS